MSKINIFFILLLSVVAIISCDEEQPDPATTYDGAVATIINTNCATASCHAGATPSGNADLSTYADVKSYADDGKLVDRMNSTTSPMPPSGLLSAEDRAVIDDWIADGTLEN